jgi:hypothetical protein
MLKTTIYIDVKNHLKLILTGLLILLIFVPQLIIIYDVKGQDENAIIFFDDFEDNQVGDYPKGWSLKDYGTDGIPSKKYVYVTDKNYYSYNKSLKISGYGYSPLKDFAVAAFRYFNFKGKFLSCQFQFYMSEVSWCVEAGFRSGEFDRIAYLYTSSMGDGKIFVRGTSSESEKEIKYQRKWLKIRFTVDIEAEKVDVYVDDVLCADDLEAKNAKSINSFWLMACGFHDVYFDDVIVFVGQVPSIMPNAKIDAKIRNVSILQKTQFKGGEIISAELTIENIGNSLWTFYVNGTISDPKNLYTFDFSCQQITLEPKSIGKLYLDYKVSMSMPAGKYNLKVACWKEKAGEYLQNRLDLKELTPAFEIIADGFDYDALEWINVIEARDIISENEDMPEVTVAIIDTGIDPDIWKHVENKGCDIMLYVRPEEYFDWGWKWPWEWGWKWRYITADNPDNPYVKDRGYGHGSMVISVIAQIVPKVKIIIFDVTYNRGSVDLYAVEAALRWIINNMKVYDIDVINMSFGSENDLAPYYDELHNLYTNYNVIFVAGSGNKDKNKYIYPASFEEVISVGGIFDDPDGYLTFVNAGKFPTQYSGHRVEESVYKEVRHTKEAMGSTFNDKIDFVAPMFDIEVLFSPGQKVSVIANDGTSLSAPIVAGSITLIFHSYYEIFGTEPTPKIVYEALQQTAEQSLDEQDATPKPIINGKVNDIVKKSDYTGWGCIDVFDAISYIKLMKKI